MRKSQARKEPPRKVSRRRKAAMKASWAASSAGWGGPGRRGQETESGAAASILRGQRCYNRGVDVRLRDSGRRRETQATGGGGGEGTRPLLPPAAIALGR